MNGTADKAVNADKRRVIVANKKLNTVADKAVDINKRQDAAAGKKPNAVTESSIMIKDQITKWTKLRDWIEVR